VNIHNPAITVPPVQQSEPSKGERTREKILDLAYDMVIQKGFAATSIEELVEAAGITKSGFFYHFRDKNDLAQAVMNRFYSSVGERMDTTSARARDLTEDPLHGYLIYLKLYAELMQNSAAENPGCLAATVAFQERAFPREVHAINEAGVRDWRAKNLEWLQRIAAVYPPQSEIDIESMADAANSAAIGGLALAKAMNDPAVAASQMLVFRELIRQVFLPR